MSQTLELLLKIRKEGGEVLTQVQAELASLRKSMESLQEMKGGQQVTASLEGMGKAAEKAGTSVRGLLDSVGKNQSSSAYLKGLSEAFTSVDQSALKASVSSESFKKTLYGGGQGAAWALGILDSLKMTVDGADEARAKIALIDGVRLDGIKSEFESLSTKLKSGLGTPEAASEIRKMSTSLNEVKPASLQAVSNSLGSLSGAARIAASAFAAFKLVDYVKDATLGAARTEVLGTVLHTMARNAGITATEIDKVDKAIQKMGITTEASREALSNMIRAGLDVGKYGAQLARMAQDSAVVAGENSSETLSRLVTNIQQMDTLGLRFMGITLDREAAETKYAQTLGISTAALTQKQKVEAVLQETLRQGVKLEGLYEASMENAGKALQSLPRYTKELADSIGNLFLPALLAAIRGTTAFLKGAKDLVDGMEGSKGAAKSMGEAMTVVVKVAGLILSAVVDVTKTLWEHRDILIGVAKIYGTALGMSAVVGLAGGVVTAVRSIAGAFVLLRLAMVATGATGLSGVIAVVGGLITKIPGLGALGGVIAGLGTAGAGAATGVSLLMKAFLPLAIIATTYAIYEAVKAYWDMKAAQDSLAKTQARFASDLKATPKEAIDSWSDFKKSLVDMTPTANGTLEALGDKQRKFAAMMAAGFREYKNAIAKTNPTEADLAVIREYEAKMLEAAKTAALLGAEAKRLGPAVGTTATAFDKAAKAAQDLTKGFKGTEYVDEFWKSLNSINDISFKQVEGAYKQLQDVVRSELAVDPERNWQKIIEAEKEALTQQTEFARSRSSVKKSFLDAEFADVKDALNQENIIKKQSGTEDLEAIKRLNGQREEYSRRSISIVQEEMASVEAARTQAHNNYVAQLQIISGLQRELANENMSYELKKFDLSTKLANDGFRVRDEAIADRERALSRDTMISKEMRDALQRGIQLDKQALEDEKRAHAKQVEGMVSNKVSSLLAEARAKLLAGDIEGAANATKAAEGMTGRLVSFQEQLKRLDEAHKLNQDIIAEKDSRAKESARQNKATFDSLGLTVARLSETFKELASSMELVAMTTRLVQKITDVESKYKQWGETTKELAKAQEDLAKAQGLFGNKDDIAPLTIKVGELTKQVGLQKESWESAKESTDAYRRSVDAIKPYKAKDIIDPATEQEAVRRVENIERKLSGLSDKEFAIKMNTQSAQAVVDSFLRQRPQPIQIDANTTGAQGDIQKVKEAVWSITKKWVVPVGVQADKKPLVELSDALNDIGRIHKVPVTVDVDSEQVRKELLSIEEASPEIDVVMDLEDTQLNREVAALDTKDVDVAVEFIPNSTAVDAYGSQIERTRLSPDVIFDADDSEVQRAKAYAQQTTHSTHYIHQVTVPGGNTGGLFGGAEVGFIQGLADGGLPTPTRASNLVSGPGTGRSDSIFSWLANGEFVLKAAAVSKYGLDHLYALNSMSYQPPPMYLADGGLATSQKIQFAPQRLNSPVGVDSSRDTMDLNFNIGGKTHPVRTSRDTAREIAHALREISRAV